MLAISKEVILIICFIVSTILFYKAAGTLDIGKMNIVSYVYYLFVLQTFIGICLIILGFNKHYTLSYLLNYETTVDKTFNAIMLASVLLPLFIYFFQRLFGIKPGKAYEEFLKGKIEVQDKEIYYKCISCLTIILLILLTGYLLKIGYVPIVKIFTAGDDFNAALERSRINNLYFVHPYITNIFILQFIPLLSYCSFAFSVWTREKKWHILTGILFVASIITKTYKFSKAPLPFHLLVYIVILIYFLGGIKKIFMLMGIGLMTLLLIGAYILTGFQGSFLDIYNGILGRTFFTQVGTLAYVFDLFPSQFDFLYGRSIAPTVMRLLGKDPSLHLRSAKLIMDFYGSEKVYDGTAGVMNSCFIGEAYANFGDKGMILGIIWVAFYISIIFVLVMKLKKNLISLTFFAVMMMKVGNITQGGFFDFIYNIDIFLTVFFFGILYYISEILNLIKRVQGRREND